MGIFPVFLGLLGLALVFGPTIMAFVVSARSRNNRRRITVLETEVESLREQLERRTGYLRHELVALKGSEPAPPDSVRSEEPVQPPVEAPVQPPLAVEAAVDTSLDDTASVTLEDLATPPTEPPAVPPEADPTPQDQLDPRPSPFDPPSSKPAIDWEHWVGVRGAALLGGVVLALAALLLLKLSIERGLIPPPVRVAIGYLAGIGAIVAGQWLRPRGYAATANALGGSGTVILYGATWAASMLYGLVGAPVAWALMILITGAACLLAWRNQSLVIAVLGLVGGFVTPLLLDSGFENPIGLFGYILLLDIALIVLGRRQGWTRLVTVCLLATTLFQAIWIFDHMDSDGVWIGLLILGVFALLFAGYGREFGKGKTAGTVDTTGAIALLLPFLFSLYFASRADLGNHLAPVAGLLAILSAAAVWLAPRLRVPWLAVSSAAASVAVVWVWFARVDLTPALAWEATGSLMLMAAIFHAACEIAARRDALSIGVSRAALWSAPGLLLATIPFGASLPEGPWPFWLLWIGLGALSARQSVLADSGTQVRAAGWVTGLAFIWQLVEAGARPEFPLVPSYCAIVLAAAIGLQLFALSRTEETPRRLANQGALGFTWIYLLGLVGNPTESLEPTLYLGLSLVFLLLALLAVVRLGSGQALCGTLAIVVLGHWSWAFGAARGSESSSVALQGLVAGLVAVVIVTAWPFLGRSTFAGQRWAWYGAALAGPVWFAPLAEHWESAFGDSAIGVLPILLGSLSLGAAVYGQRGDGVEDDQRWRNLVWFSAVALGFVTLAIPLQLDREWITIGWAVNGYAMIALWKRLDHPGLKYLGFGLLAAVSARLLLNPEVLHYHTGSSLPILNWLMYTYLVPAASLVGSAGILRSLEVDRLRSWEPVVADGEGSGRPLGAIASGLAAILVVFAWINLTIVDAFSAGGPLVLDWDRRPARDLTLSLAWAVYALVLLGLGLRRKSTAMRWLSLAFLLVTIGKVFLHDLGALEDLYRVASLVGLALSLIVVSLCYQRFVFRGDRS